MAIEWKHGNRDNDWQEYLLVSMQFSIRHILFLLFYICILLFVGKQRFNDGTIYGRKDERENYKLMSKAEAEFLSERHKKLDKQKLVWEDEKAHYIEIIEKQRKAFVELEHRFAVEQQLDILELQLDTQ